MMKGARTWRVRQLSCSAETPGPRGRRQRRRRRRRVGLWPCTKRDVVGNGDRRWPIKGHFAPWAICVCVKRRMVDLSRRGRILESRCTGIFEGIALCHLMCWHCVGTVLALCWHDADVHG